MVKVKYSKFVLLPIVASQKKSKSRKTYLKPSDSLELSGSTRNYPEDAWLFNKKLESLQSKFTPITQSENYDSTDAFMYRIWISGKIKQLPHLCFEIGTLSIAQFISLHTVDRQTSTQGWDVRKLKKHQRDKLPGTTASVVCSSSVSLIITGDVSYRNYSNVSLQLAPINVDCHKQLMPGALKSYYGDDSRRLGSGNLPCPTEKEQEKNMEHTLELKP